MNKPFSKSATFPIHLLCLTIGIGTLLQASTLHASDPLIQKLSAFHNQAGDFSIVTNREVVGANLGGLVNCVFCHGMTKTDKTKPLSKTKIGEMAISSDGWVQLNERHTFESYDKHFQAYAALKTKEAESMARILGVVDEKGSSIIHKDIRCLACHSAIPVNNLLANFETVISENGYRSVCLVKSKQAGDEEKSVIDVLGSKLTYGVSCEGCHGPSGRLSDKNNQVNAEGWGRLHYATEIAGHKTGWRYFTNQEKFQHGYKDVRSYVNRTKVCASCHIGNFIEGKVVTHEMYAAGHPPLPNLEVASFANQEPQHWVSFYQKKPELQKLFIQNVLSQEEGEQFDPEQLKQVADQTTLMLVGGLVSMAEQLRLIVDLVDPETKSPFHQLFTDNEISDDLYYWPEFANFACFNCHHDLKVKSWRRERVPILKPGRPNIHEWPLATVALSFRFLNKTEEFNTEWKTDLIKSLNKAPFGDPKTILATYPQLADRLETAAQSIALNPPSADQLPEIMMLACQLAEQEYRDYDSIRQLIWSFSVAYDEYNFITRGVAMPVHREGDEGTFQGWYPKKEILQGDEKGPYFQMNGLLNKLNNSILLELNKDRDRKKQAIELSGKNSQTLNIYRLDLSAVFNEISSYEAKELQGLFQKLGELSKQLKSLHE